MWICLQMVCILEDKQRIRVIDQLTADIPTTYGPTADSQADGLVMSCCSAYTCTDIKSDEVLVPLPRHYVYIYIHIYIYNYLDIDLELYRHITITFHVSRVYKLPMPMLSCSPIPRFFQGLCLGFRAWVAWNGHISLMPPEASRLPCHSTKTIQNSR